MSRIKKPSKLSADERAFLDRMNILDKIDPRSFRHAFEEALIDRGLTNSEVLRLLGRAKERAKWKQ
jgi:hypothetical protein